MADEIVTRTFTQIRDGYLRDLRLENPAARTEEGSNEWVRATAIANVCLPLYANGVTLAKQAWPDTGTELTLKKFGRTYGVPRGGDKRSVGTVRVTAAFALPIAEGATLVNRSNGARYETIGTTPIDPITLEGQAAVIAITPGSGSNADVGTQLAWEGAPPGVDTFATVISLSGGDLAWDNARWAAEILKRLRQSAYAGNVPHILALALLVAGVEQAFVFPCLRGAGTHDVIIMTPATGGSRIAGTALIAQVLGALQAGGNGPGGVWIGGIPEDVLRNTKVSTVVEQPVDVRIDYRASAANPWHAWPPRGVGFVEPAIETSWYKVTGTPTNIVFDVAKPATGTAVAPAGGDEIGAFFTSHGFCKAVIRGVVDNGAYWTVTTGGFVASNDAAPTSSLTSGTQILPWNAQLPNIAGAPVGDSQLLSGAVPAYFAALGSGEMTALIPGDDDTRRRRWPRTSDTNPITGEVEWPTDVTSRFMSAIVRNTDAQDVVVSPYGGSSFTPKVPIAAFIGMPPSVLVLGKLFVIPTV